MNRLIASLGGLLLSGAAGEAALAATPSTPLPALAPRGTPVASDLIPVQPAGGARLLSATAKDLRNYVLTSVDSFGADPTGVADSTSAIQAAINSGLPLSCQGLYKTSASLRVETYASNGQTIRGGGSWAIPGTYANPAPPAGACVIRPTSAVTKAIIIDGTPIAGDQLSWIQGFGLETLVIDMVNMADDANHVAINQVQAWEGHYSNVRVINDGNSKRAWLFNAGSFTTTLNQPWGHIIDMAGRNMSYEVTTITLNDPDINKLITNYASSIWVNGGALQHPYTTGVTPIVWVAAGGLGAYGIGYPSAGEGFYAAVGTDIKNSQFVSFFGTDFEAGSQPPHTCTDAGGWSGGTYTDGTHGCAPIVPVLYVENTAFDTVADSLSISGAYALDQGVGSNFPGLSQNGSYTFDVSRRSASYFLNDLRVAGSVTGPVGFTGALGNETSSSFSIAGSTGAAAFKGLIVRPSSDGAYSLQVNNSANANQFNFTTGASTGALGVVGSVSAYQLVARPGADGSILYLENAAGTAFMVCASSATIGLANCGVGNGADWKGFSDGAFSAQTYDFDASTGNGTFTGKLTSTGTGGVGYGTGAGGVVTQNNSRSTGVTINKATGAITLFAAAGSAIATTFVVTDSAIAATDTINLSVKSATNTYLMFVTAVSTGSFSITFYTTGGTASDAPVINFAALKGVAS